MRHTFRFKPEEDEQLRRLVAHFGANDWKALSLLMPGRNARQCRERWSHYLSNTAQDVPWTTEEDLLLMRKIDEFGLRWAQLVKFLPHRSTVDVQQHWLFIFRHRRQFLLDRLTPPIHSKSKRFTRCRDAMSSEHDCPTAIGPNFLHSLEAESDWDWQWTEDNDETHSGCFSFFPSQADSPSMP
jgi:hypothetical protein